MRNSIRLPSAPKALASVVSVRLVSSSSRRRFSAARLVCMRSCHRRFGQLLSLHFLLDLPCDDSFHGGSGRPLETTLFNEEIIEATSDVPVCHVATPSV